MCVCAVCVCAVCVCVCCVCVCAVCAVCALCVCVCAMCVLCLQREQTPGEAWNLYSLAKRSCFLERWDTHIAISG